MSKTNAEYLQILENKNLPEHIAIIMDGNGRWAKLRGLARTEGHVEGAQTLHSIVHVANDLGIKYLTVYAFSTENWARPITEVNFLMGLVIKFFDKYIKELADSNVRLRLMGSREGIPPKVLKAADDAENLTKDNTGLQVILAFNYGGRRELVDSFKNILSQINKNELKLEDIDENTISENLYLPDVPDPDLIIRSSGEKRLSNFLLWESAYSEFWTSNILWPDFTKGDLVQAILDYNERDRRFGGIKNE